MAPQEEASRAGGYAGAVEGSAVVARPPRHFLEISGRSPGPMLQGILSGRIPDPPRRDEGGNRLGEVSYSTLLTPKGRMITDLRVFRDREDVFLLDLPEAGIEGAFAHFQRYLPPRLARVGQVPTDLSMLTVVGPKAVGLLAELLGTGGGGRRVLEGLSEGQELNTALPGGEDVRVVRNGDVRPPAFDLILPRPAWEGAREVLLQSGAEEAMPECWDTLRMERGRPIFGVDMDEETNPVEAGIHRRAIDYEKGCYTGQEVIIRLRDRGRVNKSLRGLLLGSVSPPPRGTDLFSRTLGKSVGWITSSCLSPHFGQAIALGYVRRGASEGPGLRLGSGEGPSVEVRELADDGWR
ncbi:YgfZ/GcvT domain-containing protein [Gemmatimonadota bacterium]